MAKELAQALSALSGEPKFAPRPVYSAAGDCLFLYFDEAESYGDRVDGLLTVYRALDGDQIVGCQIKGITAILKKFGEFGLKLTTKSVDLALLFLVSNLVSENPVYSEGERRSLYTDLLTKAGDQRVRLGEPVPG